ncbi:MAG: hypothetical protein V7764_19715 [Pseudomonas marincola]|jgi:hypothetical protein|uniref:hypothetical protein n=1 Tax=Pseudomonas marincola TaxID=437900 RepID=UPI0030018C59
MHTQSHQDNTGLAAPHLALSRNVARTISHELSRTLLAIDTPAQVNTGSREYHQAEALKAASDVAFQFTAQAKKQAKRKCLGHLIASLSSSKEATSE